MELERKRLPRAQAEREEMALAKDRSEAMSLVDHERIISDLIQTTRATVRAVAPRIARDLVNETSSTMIQAPLETAHAEASIGLSKLVPRSSIPPVEPTPAPEPKPKPKPKQKVKQKVTPKPPAKKAPAKPRR